MSNGVKKIPEKLHAREIDKITDYDKMTNDERAMVFEAYSYNSSDECYYLMAPEKLNADIKEKLSKFVS